MIEGLSYNDKLHSGSKLHSEGVQSFASVISFQNMELKLAETQALWVQYATMTSRVPSAQPKQTPVYSGINTRNNQASEEGFQWLEPLSVTGFLCYMEDKLSTCMCLLAGFIIKCDQFKEWDNPKELKHTEKAPSSSLLWAKDTIYTSVRR